MGTHQKKKLNGADNFMETVIHWYSLLIAYILCVVGNKSREECVGDLKAVERFLKFVMVNVKLELHCGGHSLVAWSVIYFGMKLPNCTISQAAFKSQATVMENAENSNANRIDFVKMVWL